MRGITRETLNALAAVALLLNAEAPAFAGNKDSPGETLEKTRLSLVTQRETIEGDYLVVVKLTDEKGQPLGYAPVQCKFDTIFGDLVLKTVPTNEEGEATCAVGGGHRRGNMHLTLTYKGLPPYQPSSLETELQFAAVKTKAISLRPVFPPLVPFARLLAPLFPADIRKRIGNVPSGFLITPYPSLLLVSSLALMFLSIWSIFFYVIHLVVRIWKEG